MISTLKTGLSQDVSAIHTECDSLIARRARCRLDAVVEYFPVFMAWLVEPFLTESLAPRVETTILSAGRIHLYARILDDGLDENLPVYRRNLLRAQPLFFEAVQTLAVLYPDQLESMTTLIRETVEAVQQDDHGTAQAYWGQKNHHLLLAPLLLSGNSAAYQACRPGLSSLIALSQAGDEWRQGRLFDPNERQVFLSWLSGALSSNQLQPLLTHGWNSAAERIVREARQLLTVLDF